MKLLLYEDVQYIWLLEGYRRMGFFEMWTMEAFFASYLDVSLPAGQR